MKSRDIHTAPPVLSARMLLVAIAQAVSASVSAKLPAARGEAGPVCDGQRMERKCLEVLPEVGLEAALAAYLLRVPRYFENVGGSPPAGVTFGCTKVGRAIEAYPDIPIKECVYRELDFDAWVMLADIPAEKMPAWIVNACPVGPRRVRCVAATTAYMWVSNQLSYPIAGKAIEKDAS